MSSIVLKRCSIEIMVTVALFLFCLIIVSGCKDMDSNGTDQTTTLQFQEIDSRELNPENIPAQKVIFRDQESWKAFWEKYGKEAAPEIDFTMYIVIGVFSGPKPNPGHGVEITQIQKSGSEILVHVTEYTPNPEQDYPSVIVYPYYIVSFEKTAGEIVFILEQKVDDRLNH